MRSAHRLSTADANKFADAASPPASRPASRLQPANSAPLRATRTSGRPATDESTDPHGQPPQPPHLEPVDEAERMLSLQMALKCADLGHAAESLDVHLLWVR